MATFTPDRKTSDKEIQQMLEEAVLLEDYPEPDFFDLVDLKEYDRGTRQIFLWVSTLFTDEEREYLQQYFRKYLHPRTLIAICRYDLHFGYRDGELLTDTD